MGRREEKGNVLFSFSDDHSRLVSWRDSHTLGNGEKGGRGKFLLPIKACKLEGPLHCSHKPRQALAGNWG